MGASQVGRKHAGLRRRMALFARLRSANRAMPTAASNMAEAEQKERRASALRERLAALAAKEGPAELLATELNEALGEIDAELAEMQRDLLERFDAIPFVSLRASIPRSLESHRLEVVALLEVLISDRNELLERLPRVEYLITMLSTDEVDGRRNIVHDPVSLTPLLANFLVDSLDPVEADAIAMELYQSATLDSELEDFHESLRALRARKQSIGLGCLCPSVLRAVVTYNARMFNSVESRAEASRASDSMLDEELAAIEESLDSVDATAPDEFVEETPAAEAAPDSEEEAPEEDQQAAEPVSVFDCTALQSVIEALGARLAGGATGEPGPADRIAIILDRSSLEPLEVAAIRTKKPTAEERLVARTTVVGLILRDVGPLQIELEKLGIDKQQLSDAWVRELNESFGRLISEKLGEANAYELASKLSGIKGKHLFKPLSALNAAVRGSRTSSFASDDATSEMLRVARTAAEQTSSVRAGARAREGARLPAGAGISFAGRDAKLIAAAVCVTVALGLGISNFIGATPSDIQIIQSSSLQRTSPHLQSAYRNGKGRGDLLIGRVDSRFPELPIEERIEAAQEMVESFKIQGIREAMLYDARGMLQVQFKEDKLHRPRLGDRSTGRAPGEGAIRRTLSGERLDQLESGQTDDDEWGDDEF